MFSPNRPKVHKGPVTGTMWKHGMVLAAEHADLEPGATVFMELTPSKPVMHSAVLTKEDGASRIPNVISCVPDSRGLASPLCGFPF